MWCYSKKAFLIKNIGGKKRRSSIVSQSKSNFDTDNNSNVISSSTASCVLWFDSLFVVSNIYPEELPSVLWAAILTIVYKALRIAAVLFLRSSNLIYAALRRCAPPRRASLVVATIFRTDRRYDVMRCDVMLCGVILCDVMWHRVL